MLYLYVEVYDAKGAYDDLMYGATGASIKRKRIKKIKLTKEQEEELKVSKGEQVTVLSIQED